MTTADFTQYEGFDLLIGGFPCQDLSIGQHKGERSLSGKRSGLFWELVRAIEEVKPKYFLVENNFGMPKDAEKTITEVLGVEPILIDSQLVSAQRRKRLYWTNIPNVTIPDDKKIMFQDVIESGFVHTEKSYCLTANYNGAYPADLFKSVRSQVFEPCENGKFTVKDGVAHIPGYNRIPGKEHVNVKKIPDGTYDIRKLTVAECAKLQTMPPEFFEGFNENECRKALGNGWTVDVIAHIFTHIPKQQREEKEMELKVNTPTFPEVIEFNFEELKQEITERASAYMNLVYTEDQIKDAKKDRAALNKFVKALSDERIKVKKECMKPYEDFESKIKELDGIVSKAIKNIDDQLKSYEEHEKAEKLEKIKELWESIEHPAEMQFEHVFKEKFLNKSCLMGTITQYFKDDVDRFKRDIATLSNLPEFSFEALEVYKTTLDLNMAISEGKRLAEIQKRKAEHDEKMKKLWDEKAEQERQAKVEAAQHMIPPAEEKPTEPLKQWVSFKALITTEDAFALKDFFNSRGIPFEASGLDERELYLVSKVFQNYYCMGIDDIAKEDETAKTLFEKIGI